MKLVIDDGKKRAKKQLSESKFLHVRMYICVEGLHGMQCVYLNTSSNEMNRISVTQVTQPKDS